MVLGALIILIALPMALFIKDSPDDSGPTRVASKSAAAAPGRGARVGDVFRAPAFYLLLVGSVCSIAAVGGANQHLKLFLSLDHGYTQGDAARIASLVLATSLVGRLGAGWLADRIPKKYVMLLIYLLVTSAIPLLFLAKTKAMIYAFAIVF